MNFFATLFDRNYLSRGIALYESLLMHCSGSFRFFVLCLDDDVYHSTGMGSYHNIERISLSELMDQYPELKTAKENGSTVEFYFTLSPFLPMYILKNYPEVQEITTMDADLYFYADPALILDKYKHASVIITPHDFSPGLEHLESYGKYNVSFQSFKNDGPGRKCLEDWGRKCLEWCCDHYDASRDSFADQKYLDSWTAEHESVAEIRVSGAGIAPWNIQKYEKRVDQGEIRIDGSQLIYYHFHHLRCFNSNFAFSGLEKYQADPHQAAVKRIYHVYLKHLSRLGDLVSVRDKEVHRLYSLVRTSIGDKLLHPAGYWFFNSLFIVHLNPRQTLSRMKKHLISNGRTN